MFRVWGFGDLGIGSFQWDSGSPNRDHILVISGKAAPRCFKDPYWPRAGLQDLRRRFQGLRFKNFWHFLDLEFGASGSGVTCLGFIVLLPPRLRHVLVHEIRRTLEV